MDAIDILDGLKPERQIVHRIHHDCGDAEAEESARSNGSLGEDTRRKKGRVTIPEFNGGKRDQENPEQHEEENDTPIRPSVGAAAPLQGKEEADDARQKAGRAERIETGEMLADSGMLFRRRELEDEDQYEDRDGADGKIDVEAPAPRDALRKCSSDERSHDRRDAENSTKEPRKERSVMQRYSAHDYDHCAGKDP